MSPYRHFEGIPVSGGVVIGMVFRLEPFRTIVEPRDIPDDRIEDEVRRFEEAVEESRRQMTEIRSRARDDLDDEHAAIFDSHILMLEDPLFFKEIVDGIRREKKNAEHILSVVTDRVAALFNKIPDQYFSSRSTDMYDVANQVLGNLLKVRQHPLRQITEPVIVVSHDLGPSDTMEMDRTKVIGFVTDIGGPTSHTAIMAKALEIPAVVGVGALFERVKTGDTLIVDGTGGQVLLNPTPQELKKYKDIQIRLQEQELSLSVMCPLPAETLDGYTIELSANIEMPEEVQHVKIHGADGIGLFRTEFVYLNMSAFPDEETQYRVYRQVVEAMAPKSVIFRTLDIGGDKFVTGLNLKELNPFLGLRAIRLGLANPELFKVQLRAILRAGASGNAKIMFPMISCVEEVRTIKKLIEEVKIELKQKGLPFADNMECGIMVEIPSAAITADVLAREVDFFSIGTNDLIQYTLAVDRVNERVAYLYEPYHPAILRLIHRTINEAHRNNIWVGICGEMASDPITAILLLGMGIDELSMGPIAIPEVKRVIRGIRLADAKRLSEEILQLNCATDIKRMVAAYKRQFT
ncbi:MAG TPA: phosphoenolpyruvate--protein phosphotransferase [Candidatus Sumerlaeota bacterium]|nr:phosphoenolpyruvate--protein phosphotransferase [Candidatus Sumerlaeota bacterium]